MCRRKKREKRREERAHLEIGGGRVLRTHVDFEPGVEQHVADARQTLLVLLRVRLAPARPTTCEEQMSTDYTTEYIRKTFTSDSAGALHFNFNFIFTYVLLFCCLCVSSERSRTTTTPTSTSCTVLSAIGHIIIVSKARQQQSRRDETRGSTRQVVERNEFEPYCKL